MNYFDTSFLVPFFVDESTSSRVERFLKQHPAGEAAVSQWTHVEFSSAIALQVRSRRMSMERAAQVESAFDSLMTESFVIITPAPRDFELARQFLRRYESGLRSGDALHLAIASNNAAQSMYALHDGLLKAGRMFGLPVKSGIRLP